MDSGQFKITYSAAQYSQDYVDGFADGYSRAWRECLEYIKGLNEDETEEEAKPEEQAE